MIFWRVKDQAGKPGFQEWTLCQSWFRMRSEWNMTTLTSSCFGNVLYKFLLSCSFCFCNQNGINQIYIASPSTLGWPGGVITPIVEVLPPYCTDHPACTMSGWVCMAQLVHGHITQMQCKGGPNLLGRASSFLSTTPSIVTFITLKWTIFIISLRLLRYFVSANLLASFVTQWTVCFRVSTETSQTTGIVLVISMANIPLPLALPPVPPEIPALLVSNYGISYDIATWATEDDLPNRWNSNRGAFSFRVKPSFTNHTFLSKYIPCSYPSLGGGRVCSSAVQRVLPFEYRRSKAVVVWNIMIQLRLIRPPGKFELTLLGLKLYRSLFDITNQMRLGGEFSQVLRGPTPAGLVPAGMNPALVIPGPDFVWPASTKPSVAANDPVNYRI